MNTPCLTTLEETLYRMLKSAASGHVMGGACFPKFPDLDTVGLKSNSVLCRPHMIKELSRRRRWHEYSKRSHSLPGGGGWKKSVDLHDSGKSRTRSSAVDWKANDSLTALTW